MRKKKAYYKHSEEWYRQRLTDYYYVLKENPNPQLHKRLYEIERTLIDLFNPKKIKRKDLRKQDLAA